MVNFIIAFGRVRNLGDENVLHRGSQIDTELIVLLRKAHVLFARPVVFLRVAGDDEVRHHPGH